MSRFCSSCLSFGWFVVVVGGLAAQDDDRPLHDFGDRTLSSKNISKFLDERRSQGRGAGIDLGLMKKLIANFGDGVDPANIDPELVKNFVEQNPEFRDPKNLERLKEFVDKQKREKPEQWDPKKIQEVLKRLEEFQLKNKDRLDPKKEDPKVQPKEEPKPPRNDRKEEPKDDRRVNEMKKWMKKNFGDSPAMKNLAKQFSECLQNGSGRKLDWLPKMKKDWLPSADWFKRKKDSNRNKEVEKSSTSSLSRLPNVGSGFKLSDRSRTSSSSDSSFFSRSGSTETGTGSGFGFLSLIVLIVIGAAIWFYYLKPVKTAPMPVIELPPPPVDLSNLATREDVILAFEYLSVTKCGSEARNWHHNEIAEKMAQLADSDAASGLARLYEKARYAPSNELFTDADLAAARLNVRALSGEASA